jgi:hypothetical protein
VATSRANTLYFIYLYTRFILGRTCVKSEASYEKLANKTKYNNEIKPNGKEENIK